MRKIVLCQMISNKYFKSSSDISAVFVDIPVLFSVIAFVNTNFIVWLSPGAIALFPKAFVFNTVPD